MRFDDSYYFFYPEMDDPEEKDIICPQCSGLVVGSLGCHTWPKRRDDGTDVWMSCMQCDSAIDWRCDREIEGDMLSGCGWDYTEGLNSGNPRHADNEAKKPVWVPTQMYINRL